MHQIKRDASEKKRDLRAQPSTSLRNTDVQSPSEDLQQENSSDPQRLQSGPDIVKPSMGSQVAGQTSRQ